ncbi:hypothetical protein HELRODRAFT_158877 [Helobdella robusta]|uniref:THAP-type domain-containing protein n=1 Tax=Helobdella robusta TaxID=6412 RepID=T1ENC9_HELRO|nr:hypothetical protein HELRODRAFT_158877 [Helobdella robusta]ESO12367.1 hypothetical protein HELRODRAFT_158877 [Helobdella robusta]
MQNDWIKSIRQGINDFKWLPSKNARICSDHFCNKDYKGYDGERKVMLKGAFPCFQDIKKVILSYLFNNFNKIVLNNYSQCHFINTTLKGGYKTLMQYSEISKYTIVTFDLGDKKSPSNFPPKRSSMNFENRCVLRSVLNFASDGEVVREVGREFQRKGPEKAKADLAKECLTRVKKKREQEDDRKPGRLEGLSLRHIESDQAIIEERHRDKL